jgi:hypothetical protein
MERARVIQEYNQLRNFLNRGNKLANQQSELKFEISQINLSEYRLYAMVVRPDESHRIAIAARGVQRSWERTGFTKFNFMEDYCADFLNMFEEKGSRKRGERVLLEDFRQRSVVELQNNLARLLHEL